MDGYVKWFNADKGKGAIVGTDNIEYFFPGSEYNGSGTPGRGMKVRFDPTITSRGPRACRVGVRVLQNAPHYDASREKKEYQRPPTGLSTPEGIAKYNDINKAIKERHKSTGKSIAIIGAIAVAFGLIPGLHVAAIIGLVVVIFGLVYGSSTSRMSESNYYTIPGSSDGRGNHRCISCGHRGIRRHTPYKTNTTLADCPKCGFELWS